MLVVFSASHKDYSATKALLEWCAELGGLERHSALIVNSTRVSNPDAAELVRLAKLAGFKMVQGIKQRTENELGWPRACNEMFKLAAQYVSDTAKVPFFWCESDCIPLKERWLDVLEFEYTKSGTPFMGAAYEKPWRHLTGCAVYPPNIGRYNPAVLGATELPWDTVKPDLTLRFAHITPLLHHEWGDVASNTPWTFPNQDSLQRINALAVLFHRCKDGTLIQRLREQRQAITQSIGRNKPKWSLRKLVDKRPTISVRRTGAIGDALCAVAVADKLVERGFDVEFQTAPICQTIICHCPGIRVADPVGKCEINLDQAYENCADREKRHFADMFFAAANLHLRPRDIALDPVNIAPRLHLKSGFTRRFQKRYKDRPRPWIGICPRSNSFTTRTVPDDTWRRAAEYVHGTCFWLGNLTQAPKGIVDLNCRDINEVLIGVAAMDLMATVDTGPLHMAAALAIPTIVIDQSSSPDLHLSDQRDFTGIQPAGLTCLNCQARVCRFNADHPPCQDISPFDIANAINWKLRGLSADDVSAVIAIYRPTAERLNQCLTALLPQVSEVVIAMDQASVLPSIWTAHPKVKVVTSRLQDSGYGRKVNFGARHTAGKWLLTINDDVFLDPDAVSKLLECAQADEKIALVGCLLWYPGRKAIQHGGGRRYAGDVGWGHIDHLSGTPTIKEPTELESVTGACTLIRRKAFYEVKGFDERLKLYYEDNWLCLSLREHGWKVFYTPLAQGIHAEHSSTSQTPEIARIVEQSRVIFTSRWKEYFENNPAGPLGTFAYLNK